MVWEWCWYKKKKIVCWVVLPISNRYEIWTSTASIPFLINRAGRMKKFFLSYSLLCIFFFSIQVYLEGLVKHLYALCMLSVLQAHHHLLFQQMLAVLTGQVMDRAPRQLLYHVLVLSHHGLPWAPVLVVLPLDHRDLHVDHGKGGICWGAWLPLSLQIGLESLRFELELIMD